MKELLNLHCTMSFDIRKYNQSWNEPQIVGFYTTFNLTQLRDIINRKPFYSDGKMFNYSTGNNTYQYEVSTINRIMEKGEIVDTEFFIRYCKAIYEKLMKIYKENKYGE